MVRWRRTDCAGQGARNLEGHARQGRLAGDGRVRGEYVLVADGFGADNAKDRDGNQDSNAYPLLAARAAACQVNMNGIVARRMAARDQLMIRRQRGF